MDDQAHLRLHIEPERSIEVAELVDALGALSREYRAFCVSNKLAEKNADARLLVSSVSPGSIDINFVPDVAAVSAALIPLIDHLALVRRFAEHIKWLLDSFLVKPKADSDLTVRECDDAINIVKPIANNGGKQEFVVVKGDVNVSVINLTVSAAQRISNNAAMTKAQLKGSNIEVAQRVPMVWKRIDSDGATIEGASPDKVIIEEIDPRPRAVLFTDNMASLKRAMIDDEDKPFKKVYFVDVEVSRINGQVVSYRVIGYHGKEDLD